jgi:hypothetical protein
MKSLVFLIALFLTLGTSYETWARSYRSYGYRSYGSRSYGSRSYGARRDRRYSSRSYGARRAASQTDTTPAECPCKKAAREQARLKQLEEERGKIYMFVFPADNAAGAVIDLQRSHDPAIQFDGDRSPINWEGPYASESEAREAAKKLHTETEMPWRNNGI